MLAHFLSRKLRSKSVNLSQQRSTLTSSVLQHLIPQVQDLLSGFWVRHALGGLDTGDLEGQEELGDFDGEVSPGGADTCFGGEVDGELVFELGEICAGLFERGMLDEGGSE